jgi:hypothetical protein
MNAIVVDAELRVTSFATAVQGLFQRRNGVPEGIADRLGV